jgi:hypothetical protein
MTLTIRTEAPKGRILQLRIIPFVETTSLVSTALPIRTVSPVETMSMVVTTPITLQTTFSEVPSDNLSTERSSLYGNMVEESVKDVTGGDCLFLWLKSS